MTKCVLCGYEVMQCGLHNDSDGVSIDERAPYEVVFTGDEISGFQISKAIRIVGKNSAAVALGRAGGKKGGPARAKNLSPERRSEIASNAAKKRWKKPE